jgi:hypothetical protein
MKKLMLILLMNIGGGMALNSFGQTLQQTSQSEEKTRTVYLYIVEVENSTQAETIDNYLNLFKGKIVSASTNYSNHMCVVELKIMTDQDLIELVGQVGFTAFVKTEMPQAGQRYIYNPDGTWKIKAL